MRDPADHAVYLERYEDSRVNSVFNSSRYALRNEEIAARLRAVIPGAAIG
jgi:hypothetical protein